MESMDSSNKVTVLQHFQVSPPPGTTSNKSLPLTFLELRCVHWTSMQLLLFYEYTNISKKHFVESIIPSLKHSLSLTLKYFYPLAGNLIFPPNYDKPEIRYLEGDSVSLIFAESSSDFDHLTGNHTRNALEFYSLLPQLSAGSISNDALVVPIAAIQVTFFPNSGICVGFNINHVIGDGFAVTSIMRSWASITKAGGDASYFSGNFMPYHDRTLLRDSEGLEVETIVWNQVKKTKYEGPQPVPLPTNDVRATFVMGQATVQQLKKLVIAQYPSLSHVSTFTVTCAYAWFCMAKAREVTGEEAGAQDEMEHFVFAANCRSLFDPPLPTNYFGNCIAHVIASAKTAQLKGSNGFFIAAKSISEALQKRLHNGGGVLKVTENWIPELMEALKGWKFGVSVSPKFKFYHTDFGWGRPKKSEYISIHDYRTIGLFDGRNEVDIIEFGLSFPKPIMDAFASCFYIGLQTLDCKVKQIVGENNYKSKMSGSRL